MKNVFYLCIVLLGMSVSAQVGIGVPTSQISASAQLEVSSSSKGFLAPRMTQAQKNNIISPTAGLLVFQTAPPVGFYYFDGSVWQSGLGPQGVQGAQGATGPAGSNASITMGAFSSSSPARGAAIASGVLTLSPADVNNKIRMVSS